MTRSTDRQSKRGHPDAPDEEGKEERSEADETVPTAKRPKLVDTAAARAQSAAESERNNTRWETHNMLRRRMVTTPDEGESHDDDVDWALRSRQKMQSRRRSNSTSNVGGTEEKEHEESGGEEGEEGEGKEGQVRRRRNGTSATPPERPIKANPSFSGPSAPPATRRPYFLRTPQINLEDASDQGHDSNESDSASSRRTRRTPLEPPGRVVLYDRQGAGGSAGRTPRQKESPYDAQSTKDADEEGIRRSQRQRKVLFSNLNTDAIYKHIQYITENGELEEIDGREKGRRGRKARCVEEHEAEGGEEGEEEGDEEVDEEDEEIVLSRRPGLRPRVIKVPKKKNEDEDDDKKEDEEHEEHSYYLRERRQEVKRYEPTQTERGNRSAQSRGPYRERDRDRPRPRRRDTLYRRRRRIDYLNESDSEDSDSEHDFTHRRKRSAIRARQELMPLNMGMDEMLAIAKARGRSKASLADVDPMAVSNDVTFDHIGGLDQHIRSLKEMVLFPLIYPEIFQHFNITAPRGVLFYGPPGTGKTLVARALANECSKVGGQKVAFFMRKGADCLSKWVGESERQLRMLFDQAYLMRPSIIFFDEIDGLAPVRSSRQDQIHSSIVSVLLALMDGLDDRGQVIVIGATNRPDSIDPALRRPGRFDREFVFGLPDTKARESIIRIHSKAWTPPLSDRFVDELATQTGGYCGADIKALCAEAALCAVRRTYPQIYSSSSRLVIDIKSVQLKRSDFVTAMQAIVPAAYRSASTCARPLPTHMVPLLAAQVTMVYDIVAAMLPWVCPGSAPQEDIYEIDESGEGVLMQTFNPHRPANHINSVSPRLLIGGGVGYWLKMFCSGAGQSKYVGPAVLCMLEPLPIFSLDLPSLMAPGDNATASTEEALVRVLREAQKKAPAVLYIPHIGQWWRMVSDQLKNILWSVLEDVPSQATLLLVATCNHPCSQAPSDIMQVFYPSQHCDIGLPTADMRRAFFADLPAHIAQPPPLPVLAESLPALATAVASVGEREVTEREVESLRHHCETVMRQLRIFLRETTERLLKDRRFKIFATPVSEVEFADYYDIIQDPMDLSSMLCKIDNREYQHPKQFLEDIDLIVANAKLYNATGDPVIHRSLALQDMAYTLVDDLTDEFVAACEEITDVVKKIEKAEAQLRTKSKTPKDSQREQSFPEPRGVRSSLRVRGVEPKLPAVIPSQLQPFSPAVRNKSPKSQGEVEANPAQPTSPGNLRVNLFEENGQGEGATTEKETVPVNEEPGVGGKDVNEEKAGLEEKEMQSSDGVAAPTETTQVEVGGVVAEGEQPMDVSESHVNGEEEVQGKGVEGASVDNTASVGGEALGSAEQEHGDEGMKMSAQKTSGQRGRKRSRRGRPPKETRHTEERDATENEAPQPLEPRPPPPPRIRPDVTLDQSRASDLVDRIVSSTEGMAVDRLEDLRAALYRQVYVHRHETDRNILLEGLEKCLDSFVNESMSD